jgi:two-component system NtrC family sensor kinase
MILCFFLYLIFYGVYGSLFIRDFKIFNEDVSLLMHVGKLNNICLEIRRYEKNFIIRHDEGDLQRVVEYLNEAQKYIPQLKKNVRAVAQPDRLNQLQKTLLEYENTFSTFRTECMLESSDEDCLSRAALREIGHELVSITDQLVQHEQRKMTDFVDSVRIRLFWSVAVLSVLSFLTLCLLYSSIILPLRTIQKAAEEIAGGTFHRLPLPAKHDEVRSVLRTFNKMVTDLKEQQEKLFQAKKLSSIGTLASGTAHQINNPLNNIATSCQLAMAEADVKKNPFIMQMLKTIDQETQRAGEIVRGLLEFSRAHTFSMQEVNLKTVMDKVMLLVAGQIPAGVTVNQTVPEHFILKLDVQKMVEALLNLIINGVQSIETLPGQVSITAVSKDNQARITIRDTGVGIKPENLQKVFDPFFTTKEEGSGTGLGLAVVYGIIQKHNGTIQVKSEEGRGTRFIITLPFYNVGLVTAG